MNVLLFLQPRSAVILMPRFMSTMLFSWTSVWRKGETFSMGEADDRLFDQQGINQNIIYGPTVVGRGQLKTLISRLIRLIRVDYDLWNNRNFPSLTKKIPRHVSLFLEVQYSNKMSVIFLEPPIWFVPFSVNLSLYLVLTLAMPYHR